MARAVDSTSPRGRLGVRRRFALVIGETAAGVILHAEVRHAGRFADLVNRHNVGMVEMSDRFRFPAKSLAFRCGGISAADDRLQCDDPVKVDVASLVHDPHAAPAELAMDLVADHFGRYLRSRFHRAEWCVGAVER